MLNPHQTEEYHRLLAMFDVSAFGYYACATLHGLTSPQVQDAGRNCQAVHKDIQALGTGLNPAARNDFEALVQRDVVTSMENAMIRAAREIRGAA